MDSNMEELPFGGLADRIKLNPRRAKKTTEPQPPASTPVKSPAKSHTKSAAAKKVNMSAMNNETDLSSVEEAAEYIPAGSAMNYSDFGDEFDVEGDQEMKPVRKSSVKTASAQVSTPAKARLVQRKKALPKESPSKAVKEKVAKENAAKESSMKNKAMLMAFLKSAPGYHHTKEHPDLTDWTKYHPEQKYLLLEYEVFQLRPDANRKEIQEIFGKPFKLHPTRRPFFLTKAEHKMMMHNIAKEKDAAVAKVAQQFSTVKFDGAAKTEKTEKTETTEKTKTMEKTVKTKKLFKDESIEMLESEPTLKLRHTFDFGGAAKEKHSEVN